MKDIHDSLYSTSSSQLWSILVPFEFQLIQSLDKKRGHLHTYHVTAFFKCNPLFRSILEVDDSLDLFTCLFYTNITLLVVTDWENRNVVLKLEGGGSSPNDEELIVPNWNWWSWLVDNNQMIVQVAGEQNKEIKEMF